MYPDKQKDIEVIKTLKEKKFIDAEMAGYITDKIVVWEFREFRGHDT